VKEVNTTELNVTRYEFVHFLPQQLNPCLMTRKIRRTSFATDAQCTVLHVLMCWEGYYKIRHFIKHNYIKTMMVTPENMFMSLNRGSTTGNLIMGLVTKIILRIYKYCITKINGYIMN
jgi:lactate dehydrogenase-like 2-hydroxyacid dehydrogenase